MNYYSDFSLLRNKTASLFHSMLLELTSRHIGLQNVILDYVLVLNNCLDMNLHKPDAHEIQLLAYFWLFTYRLVA